MTPTKDGHYEKNYERSLGLFCSLGRVSLPDVQTPRLHELLRLEQPTLATHTVIPAIKRFEDS